MASRGLRGTDDGPEKIANREEREQAMRFGRRLMASVFATAILATTFVVLLPVS